MALIECHHFAETLGLNTTMQVILPQRRTDDKIEIVRGPKQPPYPTLYLLHGLSDDQTIWLRRTSIERYAATLGLAVVMPSVHRSFYCDVPNGAAYWRYISAELPRLAREFFPLSDRREDNFVAGLSMGGYGAFKLGLNCPEKFAAAASLSGFLFTDYQEEWDNNHDDERRDFLRHAFGKPKKFDAEANLLPRVVERLVASGAPKPKLYQCCGTEDFLYEHNQKFKALIEGQGFDYTYEEDPGEHEWGYWDAKIQRVLDWLPL